MSILEELSLYRTSVRDGSEFMRVPVELVDRALGLLVPKPVESLEDDVAMAADDDLMQRNLTVTQFLIYRTLRDADGRIVEREALRRAGSNASAALMSLDSFLVHMFRLRKTLEAVRPEMELCNVRGSGYFLSRKQ